MDAAAPPSREPDMPGRCPDDPAFEIRELGLVFPGGTTALDGISLSIRRGEFVAVIGPSGAGKTTFLRCLNRLLEPTRGVLRLTGTDLTHLHGATLRRARGRIGMIFQSHNLVGRLSVLLNVAAGRLRFMPPSRPIEFVRSLVGRPAPEHLDAAFQRLRQVGIEHLAHRRADTLSGGQRQRVAIARALAQEPDAILADEPIASLDPRSAEVVMDTLARIHAETGVPVVANLHQVDVARRFATRVVGLRAGRLVFDGPPDRLDDDAVASVYGDEDPYHTDDPEPAREGRP